MSNPARLTLAFIERAPKAAAEVLQGLPAEGAGIFLQTVPARLAAPVIREFVPWQAARVLETMVESRSAMVIRLLSFADTTSLVRLIRTGSREKILEELPTKYSRRLTNALTYPKHQVGAWTDPEVPSLGVQNSFADALRLIKVADVSSHIYIESNGREKYIGTLAVRDILRGDPAMLLGDSKIVKTIPLSNRASLSSVNFDERWDRFIHLPVVGRKGNLLGGLSRSALRQGFHESHAAKNDQHQSLFHHLVISLFVALLGTMRLIFESSATITASMKGVAKNES
jgi:Mg/Co/Ni transporter MgtE